MKSQLAVRREYRRVERSLAAWRKRKDFGMAGPFQALMAAYQALAWVLGDGAAAASRCYPAPQRKRKPRPEQAK